MNQRTPLSAHFPEALAFHRSSSHRYREILVLSGMLVLLCIAVFHKFIFGFAAYLFKDIGSDTLNVFYPAFVNISETLHAASLPGWSFEQGLGQNVFPASLGDPSSYLLYLLGGDHLAFGIVWVEILKIICSGLLFFGLLKKIGLETGSAYLGALLYAFSGFMIVGGGWYTFSTLGVYTALLLLSFEMLYTERKWWLFPIAIALLSSYDLVSLFTCSLFLFLYALARMLADGKTTARGLAGIFLQLAMLGTLGLIISAVFSIPGLQQMIDSPRVSGEASLAGKLSAAPVFELGRQDYLLTLLMRTFSNDLLGNGSAFKGWENYLEAPMSYCGLIVLLLVPQMFNVLKARQRAIYGALLVLLISAEIFPWFRRAFWLFQGDYFRDFSLYVSVFLILISVVTLDKIIKGGRVNYLTLTLSVSVLLLALYFPYGTMMHDVYGYVFKWKNAVDTATQLRVAIFLVLIAVNLALFNLLKNTRLVQLLILAVTITELATLNYVTVNNRKVVTAEEIRQRVGYNDYSVEAIALIKNQDAGFFRIEKNFGSSLSEHASINDSKVQHYFGSSSYHSFNQLNYINFLNELEVLDSRDEINTRWALGVKQEPLLQILTGVKYLIHRGDWASQPMLANIYSEIGRFGDLAILKSKHALPMGTPYDSFIVQSEFDKLDARRKRIALLKAILVPDNMVPDLTGMSRVSGSDIPSNYGPEELARDTDRLKANPMHMSHFSNNGIDGEIDVKARQLVFFSIPYDQGWKAEVNGNDTPLFKVDGGLSAILVDEGNHVVRLRYTPPFVELGLYISLLGLLLYGLMIFRNGRKFPVIGNAG